MNLDDHAKVRAGKIASVFVGIAAIALGILFQKMNVSFLVGWASTSPPPPTSRTRHAPLLETHHRQGHRRLLAVGLASSLLWIFLSADAFEKLYGYSAADALLMAKRCFVPFNQPGLVTIPLAFLTLILVSLVTSAAGPPHESIEQSFHNAVASSSRPTRRRRSPLPQILQQNPNHSDMLHLLGVIAFHSGRSDEALALIQRAIAGTPTTRLSQQPQPLLFRQGRLDLAIASAQKAVASSPIFPKPIFIWPRPSVPRTSFTPPPRLPPGPPASSQFHRALMGLASPQTARTFFRFAGSHPPRHRPSAQPDRRPPPPRQRPQ